jgi:hypothetical protein
VHTACPIIDTARTTFLLKRSATAPEKKLAITSGTQLINPYSKEKFAGDPMTLAI